MHERERQGGGSPLVMRQKIVGLFTWFSYDGDNRRAWFKKMGRASALKRGGASHEDEAARQRDEQRKRYG